LSAEDKDLAVLAFKGARLNASFTQAIRDAEPLNIPTPLKMLLAREERQTNFCRSGMEDFCVNLTKAIQSSSQTQILRVLASNPEHDNGSSLLRAAIQILQDRFGTPLPELPGTLAETTCQVVLSQSQKVIGGRDEVSRLLIPLLDRIKEHSNAEVSKGGSSIVGVQQVEAVAPMMLVPTPREKLPTFGAFFTPTRELAGFITKRGNMTFLHSTPKCGDISDSERSAMTVAKTHDALSSSPRPTCCKKCGAPDKTSQIPKIEGAWMKTLEQRVVNEGPWEK
jgi:hypothetical protein